MIFKFRKIFFVFIHWTVTEMVNRCDFRLKIYPYYVCLCWVRKFSYFVWFFLLLIDTRFYGIMHLMIIFFSTFALYWKTKFFIYYKDVSYSTNIFLALFSLLDQHQFWILYSGWLCYRFYYQGRSYLERQFLIAIFRGALSDCPVWPYPLWGSVSIFLGQLFLWRTRTS